MAALDETLPARFLPEPEWAADYDRGDDPERAKAWQIENDGAAEWAARKLAAEEARITEVTEQAAEWRYPIDSWERDELGRHEGRAEFFRGHLEAYGLRRRQETKEATTRLPSATISTRAPSGPTVRIADEEKLIAWLTTTAPPEVFADSVKTKRTVKIGELQKAVEVLPIDLPFCQACGTGIDCGPEGCKHDDEPLFEYDHEALPTPAYAVVLTGTEIQVEGVEAAVPPTTATVRVTR